MVIMKKSIIAWGVFAAMSYALCQCPDVVPPCICATTSLEPVHIVCDKGHSLPNVLSAISAANNSMKIDVLTINNTQIFELSPGAFDGFHIGKLQFRKSHLRTLNEGAFDGTLIDYLTDLDLTDNDLTEIPYALAHLKQLKRLNLSKNKIDKLSSAALITWKSRERLQSLDVAGNRLEMKDVHSIGSLPNVNDLNLAANRLTDVPWEMLKNYKNSLRNLNLASNRISQIRSADFDDLDELQSLSLEYNNISTVATDAFRRLANLRYLYMTGNRLTSWPSDLFRPLVSLRNLGMGSSAIGEIPADAFKYLPKLIRLEMSNGGVERIDANAFQNTPRLHALLLNNNRISQIKRNTFQTLTELYTLDLSSNRLDFIEDRSFENLNSLKHLDLSNNRLKSLFQNTFNGTFLASRDTKTLYLCKNSWLCDEQLNWFRHWTRENLEIVIDKPNCTTTCFQPDWLSNWPIRFPNPPPGGALVVSTVHSLSVTPTARRTLATAVAFQRAPLQSGVFKELPSKDQPARVVTSIAHFLFGQLPIKLRNIFQST